ncbi:MAG: hypothetical protein JO247_05935 [Chloroflexi bacterium]|nr:hypothetical protein [Chloroflexota bacterium]
MAAILREAAPVASKAVIIAIGSAWLVLAGMSGYVFTHLPKPALTPAPVVAVQVAPSPEARVDDGAVMISANGQQLTLH